MNPFPAYLAANKSALGVARDVDTFDFHVECIDLLENKVDGDIGVAFLVACYSILRKASPVAGLLVMGGKRRVSVGDFTDGCGFVEVERIESLPCLIGDGLVVGH